MLNPISTVNRAFGWGNSLVGLGSTLAGKIGSVASPYIAACAGLYHCKFGTTQLSKSLNRTQQASADKAERAASDLLIPSNAYLNLHGGLLTATGICSAVEAFHNFGWISYGKWVGLACTAGSIFFVYANFIDLEENVRIYNALQDNPGALPPQDMHKLKLKTLFGIISNIGYIIAAGTLLLGGPTAMALGIGMAAALSGGLKILYEWSFARMPPSVIMHTENADYQV